jgi:WD40 repeat protein
MIARSGDGRVVVFGRLDDAYLWRASEPNRVTLIELPARRRGGFGFKRGYAVSNSGERLYILDNDGQLDAYFIQSDGGIRSLGWSGIPHGTALSLAPSGRYLAMGDIDGRILVIDVESGKASARPFESPVGDGGTVRVLGLAFSPLGDELAASYADGTVRLVAVGADGSCERRVKLPGTHLALAPNPLAFDSTGGRLAVIGDRSVSVWDLARLREELNSLGLGW